MRGGLAALGLLFLGCGHSTPAVPQAVKTTSAPVPAADKETQLFQNMRTASNDIDVSLEDLEDGMKRSKALGAVAGGDAARALANVTSLLNTAGEALSDYDDVPATLEDFKADFAANDEKRLKSIDATVSALQAVGSASDVLGDLSETVPAERKADLTEIANDTDEAGDDLREAIRLLGGKVPKDEEDSGDGE
jgi:hypothetical protein